MTVFYFISALIIVLYVILISAFLYGWNKLDTFKTGQNYSDTYLSVVIAFRNEVKTLPALLKSLDLQNLNEANFEIIFVNDHSEDDSFFLVQQAVNEKQNYKVANLEDGEYGKKAALQLGIKNAVGKLIVVTDADCTMSAEWLSSILNYYDVHKPVFISGPVEIKTNSSFFSKLQALEFISLICSGAGAIGINKPIMCNAANMAFEKNFYLEKQNVFNAKYASGDDIFLLLEAKKEYLKRIHFLKSEHAIVYTKSANSVNSFFQQRIRWASKSKAYRDFDIIFSAFTVYLTNLLILVLAVVSIINTQFAFCLLGLLLIKTSIDFAFLYRATSFFNKRNLLVYFPLTLLFAIIYTVVTPLLSLFVTVYWKDRKI